MCRFCGRCVPACLYSLRPWAFTDLQSAIERFGLVPRTAFNYGGLNLLSSFFIHAGWLHLIGNLYFLVVFGDDVEEVLGRLRFVALVLAAVVVGGLLHAALHPDPDIPCVGASGGISGILAFYTLSFPQARIGFMWFMYYRPLFLRLTARWLFLLWVLYQVWLAWMQTQSMTSVSGPAHLGGAAVGVTFWLLQRPTEA